jgi:hypothetical protein
MNRANLINFDQILQESGLKKRPVRHSQKTPSFPVSIKDPSAYEENPVQKTPEVNKQLAVPQNEDFSLNLNLEGAFVVLKSIQGDLKNIREKSKQDKGIFLFHSGKLDSKIHFQFYDLSGDLKKNVFYYIKVKAPIAISATSTEQKTNIVQQAPPQEEKQNAPSSLDISGLMISAVEGESPTESIRELEKSLSSEEIKDSDKEKIRYRLIELLISQRSFDSALVQINRLNDASKKYYYLGNLYQAKKIEKEAVKNYLSALGGNDETRKASLLQLEDLIIHMGTIDKNNLDTIKGETQKMKNDKRFYALSQINIARIYEIVPDIYTAKEIFESIINGNYDADIEQRALEYYQELKKDFLEYR